MIVDMYKTETQTDEGIERRDKYYQQLAERSPMMRVAKAKEKRIIDFNKEDIELKSEE